MRYNTVFLMGMLLALVLSTALAFSFPSPTDIVVPKTSSTIVVDALLNFTSEWNGSAVLVWYNPLSEVELDRVYILHNDSHYFFGAVLYDPDHKGDDSLTLYVNASGKLYKYVLDEDSSTPYAYNYTGGSWVSITPNATFKASKSACYPWGGIPWIYMELALEKGDWDSATSVLLYIEHRHTWKTDVMSRYPVDANATDQSKWVYVEFKELLGQYSVSITLYDRDGNYVDYVANETWAVFSFKVNGSIYTQVAPNTTSVSLMLPSENYTVSIFVGGVLIYNTSLNVNTAIVKAYTLNNLAKKDTIMGRIIVVVEWNSNITAMALDCDRGVGVIIINGTRMAMFRAYSKTMWRYTVALNALNFTYDPFANDLRAYIMNGTSGVILVCAPCEYPVFYNASNLVKGYTYSVKEHFMDTWILAGTYRIYKDVPPFAVVLNGSALKKGSDYSVNVFNITEVVAGAGVLRVYYDNPIGVRAYANESEVVVTVSTPYSFNGRVVVKVYKDGVLQTTAYRSLKFSSGINTVRIALPEFGVGDYSVTAIVYDDDSGVKAGEYTTAFTVEEAVVREVIGAIPWELWVLIIILVILLAWLLVNMYVRYAKSLVSKPRRYLKL